MNSVARMGVVFMLLFTLIGCTKGEEKDSSKIVEKTYASSMKNEDEKPPNLKLTIGDKEIKTYRGAYAWSYFDKHSGQQVFVQTDHASPTQMVNIDKGIPVNITEPIKLNFEKEPTRYEIKVWDDYHVIATYNTFEEINENGKFIIEIVGAWGDSTATYVVPLNITRN